MELEAVAEATMEVMAASKEELTVVSEVVVTGVVVRVEGGRAREGREQVLGKAAWVEAGRAWDQMVEQVA